MNGRQAPLSRGGSVLILTLWVVFFLAALTLAIGAHVAAVLNAAERLSARARGQAQAAGAAAYAAALIQSQTNTWDGLQDGAWTRDPRGFRDVDTGDLQFSLMFTSPSPEGVTPLYGVLGEESKIHLNRAPAGLLAALFMTVTGMGSLDAMRLAGAVAAARGDADEMLTGEGTGDYYLQAGAVPPGAGRPLQGPEALLRVDGMDENRFRQLRPYVTVWGAGLVNINAASEKVLEALGLYAAGERGGGAAAVSLAAKIGRYRAAGNGFEQAAYLSIRTSLEGFEPLNGDEGALLTAMAGMLTVRSTAFGASVLGVTTADAGADMAAPLPVQVDFVWDSQARRFAMWRER